MAQIRSKQIADFLSSVNWASVNSTDIANAADIKALVSSEIAAVNGDNSAVSDALVAEISATNSDFVRVEANLTNEIESLTTYVIDEVTSLEGFINGEVDTTSDEVKKWTPSSENYTFTEVEGGTEVTVDVDMTDEYTEQCNAMWPKALAVLKEVAER